MDKLRQLTVNDLVQSSVSVIREGLFVVDAAGVIRASYLATPSVPLPTPQTLLALMTGAVE